MTQVFGEVVEGLDTLMRMNEAYADEKERPYKIIRSIPHSFKFNVWSWSFCRKVPFTSFKLGLETIEIDMVMKAITWIELAFCLLNLCCHVFINKLSQAVLLCLSWHWFNISFLFILLLLSNVWNWRILRTIRNCDVVLPGLPLSLLFFTVLRWEFS